MFPQHVLHPLNTVGDSIIAKELYTTSLLLAFPSSQTQCAIFEAREEHVPPAYASLEALLLVGNWTGIST